MRYLWEDFKCKFEKAIEYSHWSRFTEFDDINFSGSSMCGSVMANVLCKLNDIEKQSYALPYLINCAEFVHNWLKTLPNYTELMMYSWYKVISEVAFEVTNATDVWNIYKEKVDEMSEKNYEISDSNFED